MLSVNIRVGKKSYHFVISKNVLQADARKNNGIWTGSWLPGILRKIYGFFYSAVKRNVALYWCLPYFDSVYFIKERHPTEEQPALGDFS